MGDRSRNRSAVADDRIGDLWGGVRHNLVARGQQARALRGFVAKQRSDAKRPVPLLDKVQVLDAVDVDQMRRAREAQLQQWDQALAACQHLGVLTKLIEEAKRFVHRLRGVIFERRWQH